MQLAAGRTAKGPDFCHVWKCFQSFAGFDCRNVPAVQAIKVGTLRSEELHETATG